jgi:HEAT repeat protein
MKPSRLFLTLYAVLAVLAGSAGAAEQALWGPSKYDVKERYGKENRALETIKAPEGPAVLRVLNGEKLGERSDLLSLSLNGEVLLPERTYDHRYLACFVKLGRENSLDVNVMDFKPSGFKRPPATPKNLVLTLLPTQFRDFQVVLGLTAWEGLDEYVAAIQKVKAPAARTLVLAAADLKKEAADRANATRRLADLKEASATEFLLHLYTDANDSPDVRGEAAIALGLLGDKSSIPVLIRGISDPADKIRIGSAHALSFFPEEDTKEALSKLLERMDSIVRGAAVRTIVEAGWRPVSTLIGLAESTDPVVANTGIELLTGTQDPRAVDVLIKYLDAPKGHDSKTVIRALGETKSKKAADALVQHAQDPARRKGHEADIANALIALNDPRAEETIVAMLKKTESSYARGRLMDAYKKLTGRDYK